MLIADDIYKAKPNDLLVANPFKPSCAGSNLARNLDIGSYHEEPHNLLRLLGTHRNINKGKSVTYSFFSKKIFYAVQIHSDLSALIYCFRNEEMADLPFGNYFIPVSFALNDSFEWQDEVLPIQFEENLTAGIDQMALLDTMSEQGDRRSQRVRSAFKSALKSQILRIFTAYSRPRKGSAPVLWWEARKTPMTPSREDMLEKFATSVGHCILNRHPDLSDVNIHLLGGVLCSDGSISPMTIKSHCEGVDDEELSIFQSQLNSLSVAHPFYGYMNQRGGSPLCVNSMRIIKSRNQTPHEEVANMRFASGFFEVRGDYRP